ncbi:MAG: hypothetical protein ABRQ23_00800 [Syntrophomonadaceae bacterium]
MKIRLVWPDCDTNKISGTAGIKNVFWVECTYQEALDRLIPYVQSVRSPESVMIVKEMRENYESLKNGHGTHKSRLWKQGWVYFLISHDLKYIKSMPHYFPYSGMWNDQNPFRSIFPQTISRLREIYNIDMTPIQFYELRTWAGRSSFRYAGSVEKGTIILFGKDGEIKIRPSQYANMLGHFGGRSVAVGTSRTDPPRGSLGEWLKGKVTKVAIASYIAPILINEGLARRDENDSSMINFVDGVTLDLDWDSVAPKYKNCGVSVWDQDTGEWLNITGGIDGKTLRRLEEQGRVIYKRVQMTGG